MAKDQQKFEQNSREETIPYPVMITITGFFGAVLWSLIGYLAYFFHFTEIRPNTLLEPWALGDWKNNWIGDLVAILFIGVIGIGAAFLYYLFLRKNSSIWAGIIYGSVLFIIVFLLLNPLIPSFNPITKLHKNTIITTLCLYILFGVFVGYTISYEYQEQKKQQGEGESSENQTKG